VSTAAPVRPDADEPIATVRLTRAVAIRLILASVVAFFAFAYCFGVVLAAIRGASLEPIVVAGSLQPGSGPQLLAALALVVLVVVLHELLHGVFMARYGDTPAYGVGVSHFVLPYAYARTRGGSYARNQLLVVLLAPVTVITAVGLLAMVVSPSPLLIVLLAANAAGSVGDLWMAGILCQYSAGTRVGGHPHSGARGFAVYGPPGESAERLPGAEILATVAAGAVGTLVASTVILVGLVFQSLAFGSGTVVVDLGGWTVFRHELRPNGTVALEVGGWLFAGLALVGGLAWAAAVATRRSLQ
jgi:hypothetical protein